MILLLLDIYFYWWLRLAVISKKRLFIVFFMLMFATLIVFINSIILRNMRQLKIILLLVAFSCSVFAQDRLSLFISRANKYASVKLSDYRKRLCIEYNTPNNLLDDYYRQCGKEWGNVGRALGIAKTSGRHMRDVCDYYKRYHRHGWDRVLIEIGIRPGSVYYNPFYDRVNYHSNCWHEHYCSYCSFWFHYEWKLFPLSGDRWGYW